MSSVERDEDRYYTELDLDLQKLAMTDWATFCKLLGDDAILSAKICMLRSRGKSHTQIERRLGITNSQVRYACQNKCAEKQPEKK